MSYNRENPTLKALLDRLHDYFATDVVASDYALSSSEAKLIVDSVQALSLLIASSANENDSFEITYVENGPEYEVAAEPLPVSSKEEFSDPQECLDICQRKVEVLEEKLLWLVKHTIDSASISRAKGAEILGIPLIDLDHELAKI